jgi:putative colanic acid biosynthesis acetyltransferase WcaF
LTDDPVAEPYALDIGANRRARKWSGRELVGRALWELLEPLFFRISPRPLWAWRNALLRLFGARIGRGVHIHSTVRIAVPWNLNIGEFAAVGDAVRLYSLGVISIGPRATISQGAHLCAGTHDYRRADLPLVKASISVEDGAWICADAYVGPNVTVGSHAIVAARAAATADVPRWTIVAGVPAKVVRPRPPIEEAEPLQGR